MPCYRAGLHAAAAARRLVNLGVAGHRSLFELVIADDAAGEGQSLAGRQCATAGAAYWLSAHRCMLIPRWSSPYASAPLLERREVHTSFCGH